MATCRHCGINSRDPSQPITITKILAPTELGTLHLLQGERVIDMKTVIELKCRCGYSIRGWIDGDTFYGEPDTEHFPE